MSKSDIFDNAKSISKQIENIYLRGMELSKAKEYKPLNFVDNLTWFHDMKLIEFLSEMGRYVKVNNMLSRNWYN